MQLSGIDAGFLYSEGPTIFGHIGSVYFLDPSTASEPLTFERIRSIIRERLPLVPLYRRRLVEVPMGLDHPYWVEDPGFDLDDHVHHIALPSPGTDRQLADLIATLATRHLDRSRPLWELWVIEGHESGYLAHYSKVHHCAIDGVSGAELLTASFDTEQDSKREIPADAWHADPLPSQAEMMARGWGSLAAQPFRMARFQYEAMRAWSGRSGSLPPADQLAESEGGVSPLFGSGQRVPMTLLNKAVSGRRSWAFGSLPLSDVKTVKNAYSVTVNDVVMAICGGALRAWLATRGGLPDDPLIAMVPVSIRSDDEKGAMGNRISAILASLGTHIADPVERLLQVHLSTKRAKEQHQAMPASLLLDAAQFSSPALAAQASQLNARMRSVAPVVPSFNVTVSNVPGSRVPLWSAGARLVGLYPVSTIMDYHGLGFTVQSYLEQLDFGIIADREMVPDAWELLDLLRDALAELTAAAVKQAA